jgi:hypothetical protein
MKTFKEGDLPAIGSLIGGKYIFEEELGRGSFGVICKCSNVGT